MIIPPIAKKKLTNLIILPNIRLHSYAVVRMFPQKGQPQAHGFWVSILDLNQPPQRFSLKILLTLLMNEMRSRHSPSLYHSRQWYRSVCRQFEIICSAESEIGKELQIANTVRSELEIARGDSILGFAAEGLEVDCLNVTGVTDVEDIFVGWFLSGRFCCGWSSVD